MSTSTVGSAGQDHIPPVASQIWRLSQVEGEVCGTREHKVFGMLEGSKNQIWVQVAFLSL